MNELPEQSPPEFGTTTSRPLPKVWRALGWGFCFSVITYGIIDTLLEFGVMDWDSTNTAQSVLPGIAFLLGGYLGVTTKASSKKLIIVTICFPVTISLLSPLIRYNATKAISEYEKGVVLFEQGEGDAAIACFTRAIELKPDYALPYAGRGVIYSSKGHQGKAVADFNELIRLEPTRYDGYVMRGNAYVRQGDHDKALADGSKAIQLEPTRYRVYFFRGTVYFVKGEFSKAIADVSTAIQLDPTAGDAYFFRGVAYQELGDADNAAADFAKAKELGDEPDEP